MIDISITLLWVIAYKELNNNKIIRTSQDNDQEWVSLFSVIYTVVLTISFILIYKGKSGNLRNI